MRYIHSAIAGAVGGDTGGSCFEFPPNNYKGTRESLKNFIIIPPPHPLARGMRIAKFGKGLCQAYQQKVQFSTDDTILTIGGVAKPILEYKNDPTKDLATLTTDALDDIAHQYSYAGWGGSFRSKFMNKNSKFYKKPYNSMGNGGAMRVSAAGFAADSLAEAEKMGEIVTAVTHNHPDGIKSGRVIAGAVYLAKAGKSRDEIIEYCAKYYPELNDPKYTLDYCKSQSYSELAPITVPMALVALRDSNSYQEAIENALYIGGDTDTIGSIVGGIAGTLFGVPEYYYNRIMGEDGYLDNTLRNIATEFESKFQPKLVEVQEAPIKMPNMPVSYDFVGGGIAGQVYSTVPPEGSLYKKDKTRGSCCLCQ